MAAVGRSMGGIYPGQSAARIGCDHLPPISALHVQGQGSGAPMWSVAVHWVRWPWGFPGGAGQAQPPPVFCLGPPCLSWLLFMLGLEIPRRSLSVNLGWLLLVLGLGSLRSAVAYLRGFRKL